MTETQTQGSEIERETAMAAVDVEPLASNQREFVGHRNVLIAALCVAYSVFHLMVMNVYPLETWAYRLSHVGGGLFLGFLLFGASTMGEDEGAAGRSLPSLVLLILSALGILVGLTGVAAIWINGTVLGQALPPAAKY